MADQISFDVPFGGAISDPDNEDDSTYCDSDEEFWSSDDDESNPCVVNLCSSYGGYYLDPFTSKIKTFYRFVKPDLRTSYNAAATALKEPVSLLTKYKHQRSSYFHEILPSPSKALRVERQVCRGSRLRQIHAADDDTLNL